MALAPNYVVAKARANRKSVKILRSKSERRDSSVSQLVNMAELVARTKPTFTEHALDGQVKVSLVGKKFSIEFADGLVADERLAEALAQCLSSITKQKRKSGKK
jgi:hypothetical protein